MKLYKAYLNDFKTHKEIIILAANNEDAHQKGLLLLKEMPHALLKIDRFYNIFGFHFTIEVCLTFLVNPEKIGKRSLNH